MKPLIVLIGSFVIVALASFFYTHSWHLLFSGNLAMSLMLMLTATGHFLFPKGMVMMLPPIIPFKKTIVLLSGVFEIVAGILLLFTATRETTGWMLLLFFILVFPVNIYAAYKSVNLEKATYEGPGLKYLWFRVPEQLLFIGWVYYFST